MTVLRKLLPASLLMSGVAVFGLAGPASAHSAGVKGVLTCSSAGQEVITWTVGPNSETAAGRDMTIVSATPSQGTVVGLAGSIPPAGSTTGTTTLAGHTTGTITLTVNERWAFDGYTPSPVTSNAISLPGTCDPVHMPENSPMGLLIGPAVLGVIFAGVMIRSRRGRSSTHPV